MLLAFLLLPAVGWCGSTPASPLADARSWPAADTLFLQDPQWVGGDGASSVDLGSGRICWLFGDSLIDVDGNHSRSAAAMVRNSLAIQTGRNPTTAAIAFYWRRPHRGRPSAYFESGRDRWVWPAGAVRLADGILIFLMEIRPESAPPGFAFDRWSVVRVADTRGPPDTWQLQRLTAPGGPAGVALGAAGLLQHGDHLYALGTWERAAFRPVFSARWPLEDLKRGRLDRLQWWMGPNRGWQAIQGGADLPAALFYPGQTESSIHRIVDTPILMLTQSLGFGAALLAARCSRAVTGVWSAPTPFYTPPETETPDAVVYAAKSHPHLSGAGLVVTYATNSLDPDTLAFRPQLYYPRFVRVTLDD